MCWTYIYQYAEAINDYCKLPVYRFTFLYFLPGNRDLPVTEYPPRKVTYAIFLSCSSFYSRDVFYQRVIGLYCLVSICLFMSIMFPTIYGIALSGLKNNNEMKIGAAGIVMAIVGGAFIPVLQGLII